MCSPLQLPFQPPFGDQDYTNIDVIFMVICRRILRRVCRRDNAGVNALRSARLDDQEAVSVGVAEEELRRHGIGHDGLNGNKARPALPRTRNLGIHVNASGAEGCVVSLDVLCRKRAMSLVTASGLAFARGDQRDRVYCARRGDFDPAPALAVREVRSLLEPELVEVELQRSLLIANRDEYGTNLADRVVLSATVIFRSRRVRSGFRPDMAFFFVVMMISPVAQVVELRSRRRSQGEALVNLSHDEIDQ